MPGTEGYRPFQPVSLQFGERSTPGTPGGGSGERRGQQFSLDRPVNLVGNIRTMVQQERAEWERIGMGQDFNAAWWLRDNLNSIVRVAVGSQEPEDKQNFFDDLSAAWQLVAYEQLDGENSSTIYTDLSGKANLSRNLHGHTSSVTLLPLGVTLLDAMVEALDIPDYTPGQTTFDLSLFNGYAEIERLRRHAPRHAPTKEQVKRAIVLKPKNRVDEE